MVKSLSIVTIPVHATKLRIGEGSTTIPMVLKYTTGVRLKRVGEIPLNGKGTPLTDNAEGEEIVWTYTERYRE